MMVYYSRSCFMEVLPYVVLISLEILEVGLATLNKAAMTRGMSQFVVIAYSHAIGALILVPSSYILERKRGPLTFRLLGWFFFLGMIGVTIIQMFVLTGISYSSPALASGLGNLVPAYTFILAVLFRLEKLNIRSSSTQAKVLGTLVCISGALVATLYRGLPLYTLSSSLPLNLSSPHSPAQSSKKNWVLGGVFLFTSGIGSSFWNILQAKTLKEYPWEITVTAFNILSAAIQSATITLIVERRNPSAWRLNHKIEIIATLYTAIIGNVVTFYVLIWCIRKKGPIFMVTFKPLGIVIATLSSTFVLGDTLYLGRVIGGIIIVAGFYSVMWGRAKEDKMIKTQQEEKNREDIHYKKLKNKIHHPIEIEGPNKRTET